MNKYQSNYDEHLLPSIFDRLTDDNPRSRKEKRASLIHTHEQYRSSILRDILYILNANNTYGINSTDKIPTNILRSSINFGTPALSGMILSEVNWQGIEQQLQQALVYFEPRLDADTLSVKVLLDDERQLKHNRLTIEIQGKFKIDCYPQEFWLKTLMDIETGNFDLIEGD